MLDCQSLNYPYYLPYLILMKPTYLPTNANNKKQRIWRLVSEGKFTPDQIASMVHTTKEYVWKETSRLRKARIGGSLIVRRNTTELSKTKDETSMTFQSQHEGEQGQIDISVLNNNTRTSTTDRHFHINKSNQYLDIPEMGPGELKILYGEFNAGKKPFEVIADRGYHPDIVEFEYHRFMRLSDRDVSALLKTIIADCEGYLKPADRLTFLIRKYYNEGYLSNDDIYELIKLRIEHESQSRLESLMHNSIDPLLEGIVRLKCNVCKMLLPGALLDSRSGIGNTILNQNSNVLCASCTLDRYDQMRRQHLGEPSS